MDLLDRYTPNFVWKNRNALIDYGLIIEEELPYIVAKRKYEEKTILGSNRILHEWFGDYEHYDLEIPNVSIPYENLEIVKNWLIGQSMLITHNDLDKQCRAICSMSNELKYQNEWGTFYTLGITFRCEPLKSRVNEQPILLNQGENTIFNSGDECSTPFFDLYSNGGDISIECGNYKLNILSTVVGRLTIDNELAVVHQNAKRCRTKGNWIKFDVGKLVVKITGNVSNISVLRRSVYL